MNYGFLHEVEHVEFHAIASRKLNVLKDVLFSSGFIIHDDVASLDRKDSVQPWQHSSIVEVEILDNGDEVFGFDDGNWDKLIFKYLFSSLPFKFHLQFIDSVFEVSKKLRITPSRNGLPVSSQQLKNEFSAIRDQLIQDTGEDAGSENLAILISSTYPRR